MKALRIIGYVVGGLLLTLVVLIAIGSYVGDGGNTSAPGITQSMSVGGKTVHFVSKSLAAYTASNEGDRILLNGKPLDLSGGNEFTVEIAEDGSTSQRPGKP
jgi:hypothetical protein